MRSRKSRSAAFFAGMTALFAATEAHAASRGAFIRDGEYWGFDYGAFEQGLAAGGASPVERAPALPPTRAKPSRCSPGTAHRSASSRPTA